MLVFGADFFVLFHSVSAYTSTHHRSEPKVCRIEIKPENGTEPTYKEVSCTTACCEDGCCAWYYTLAACIVVLVVFLCLCKLTQKFWMKFCKRHPFQANAPMPMVITNQPNYSSGGGFQNNTLVNSPVTPLLTQPTDTVPTYKEATLKQ